MKHYSPTGRRNHGRPLKRLLDTWDRNGWTSGPTPWHIWWWCFCCILLHYTILQYMSLYSCSTVLYYYSMRCCSTYFCSNTTVHVSVLILQHTFLFHTAAVYDAAVQFYTATLHDTALHVSVPYCYSIWYCSTYFCTATVYDAAVLCFIAQRNSAYRRASDFMRHCCSVRISSEGQASVLTAVTYLPAKWHRRSGALKNSAAHCNITGLFHFLLCRCAQLASSLK